MAHVCRGKNINLLNVLTQSLMFLSGKILQNREFSGGKKNSKAWRIFFSNYSGPIQTVTDCQDSFRLSREFKAVTDC